MRIQSPQPTRPRRVAAALVACLAVALLILPGCTSAGGSNTETIRVGVCAGPYQDMFEHAIELFLTEQGYSVKYIEFSDYVQPNNALADGEIDLNLADAAYVEQLSEGYCNVIAVQGADADAEFTQAVKGIVRSDAFKSVIDDPNNIFAGFGKPSSY